jgi:hypothetical protein
MDFPQHQDPMYLFGRILALECLVAALLQQSDTEQFFEDAPARLESLRTALIAQALPIEPMLSAVSDVEDSVERWKENC